MNLLGICSLFCLFLLPNLILAADRAEFEKEVAKYNSFFYKMCKTPFIDSVFETSGNSSELMKARYNDETEKCTQVYPLAATEEQANYFCRNAMPFEVDSVQIEGNNVTCVWTRGGYCPDSHIQIYEKCYIVKPSCETSDRLASPFQEDQVRWLSRLVESYGFGYGNPLVIKMTRVLSGKKVHEDKYYHGGAFITPKNPSDLNNFNWALVTVPNRIYGMRPGDVVRTNTKESLCERNVERTDGSSVVAIEAPINPMNKEVQELGNGAIMSRGIIQLKKGTAFVTRNDYLPKLIDESGVDLKYFHDVCRSFCEKCVAASGELLTEIGKSMSLPMGAYHVPVARDSTGNGGVSVCGGPSPPLTERRKFRALLGPEFKSKYTPKEGEWFKKGDKTYPTADCSDGERFSVQFYQGNGEFGYIDAPVFDRKPIICYEGILPEQPRDDGACYKNSEMVDGKCQCKPGYDEGLDSNLKDTLIKRKYTERGYICFKEVNCFKKPYKDLDYKGFFYLADGSGTMQHEWRLVRPFVEKFKNVISHEVPVWLMQWSSPRGYSPKTNNEAWGCETRKKKEENKHRQNEKFCPDDYVEMLKPGWTDKQFDEAADRILTLWQDGWTLPYYYIAQVANIWDQYKKDNPHILHHDDRALLIFVSDGEWQEDKWYTQDAYQNYHFKAQSAWHMADVTFVGVHEGADPNRFNHFKMLRENWGYWIPEIKIMQIPEDGSQLNDELTRSLMSMACHDRTEDDIIDAIG